MSRCCAMPERALSWAMLNLHCASCRDCTEQPRTMTMVSPSRLKDLFFEQPKWSSRTCASVTDSPKPEGAQIVVRGQNQNQQTPRGSALEEIIHGKSHRSTANQQRNNPFRTAGDGYSEDYGELHYSCRTRLLQRHYFSS